MTPSLLAAFLLAVSLVESGGDAMARGQAGERGRYQLTPAAAQWARAQGAETDAEQAAAWARRLEAELSARGVAPLPFNLALAWNAGAPRAATGRAPVRSYRFATRVVNVMEAPAP